MTLAILILSCCTFVSTSVWILLVYWIARNEAAQIKKKATKMKLSEISDEELKKIVNEKGLF